MKMPTTPPTTATVNGWFQTINGLPATAAPISSSLAAAYVAALNANPPTATPAQIQAILENFPFSSTPPSNQVASDVFFRTTVADFVLREFQAAWGVVPNATEYSAWVGRIIANPGLESNGGMSMALAGTPEFFAEYGTTSATQPATAGFINQLAANLGVTAGAGAMLNVGLPVWQVLQNFVEAPGVIARLDAPNSELPKPPVGRRNAEWVVTLPSWPGRDRRDPCADPEYRHSARVLDRDAWRGFPSFPSRGLYRNWQQHAQHRR
jgi:hypothetical protein